jgi:hypothetical protein
MDRLARSFLLRMCISKYRLLSIDLLQFQGPRTVIGFHMSTGASKPILVKAQLEQPSYPVPLDGVKCCQTNTMTMASTVEGMISSVHRVCYLEFTSNEEMPLETKDYCLYREDAV